MQGPLFLLIRRASPPTRRRPNSADVDHFDFIATGRCAANTPPESPTEATGDFYAFARCTFRDHSSRCCTRGRAVNTVRSYSPVARLRSLHSQSERAQLVTAGKYASVRFDGEQSTQQYVIVCPISRLFVHASMLTADAIVE